MRSFTPYLLLLAIACAHAPVSRDSSPTPTTGSATLPHMEPPAAPPPAFHSVHRADKRMREGKPAEALPLYLQAWEAGNQQANTAYSLACATALLGKRDEAMTWLERSVEKGYRDADWMKQDEDLASLRELPAFSTLMQRIPMLPPPTKDEGSHPELRRLVTEDQEYHERIYERLDEATKGCSSIQQCQAALTAELRRLSKQISTEGTSLNKLVTRSP